MWRAQRVEARPASSDTVDHDCPVWTRRIGPRDLVAALGLGWRDFAAAPLPGLVLGAGYVAVGLALLAALPRDALVPLAAPLVAAFGLVGPFAALGHYRLSRRRELGLATRWWQTPALLVGPRSGAVFGLGLVLVALMLAWLAAAALLTRLMLPPPGGAGEVLHAMVATAAGHRLLLVGSAVGLVFAVPVVAFSVVAFAMLVDRDVDVVCAALTSCAAVLQNPLALALWTFGVALALVVAALPVLVGLAVVVPVLGHATWHLYRRLVIA